MGSELLDDLDYLDERIPKQIYSGFWIRLGAAIFDWIALLIILLFWVALGGLLGLIVPNSTAVVEFLQTMGTLIIMFLYFPFCESSRYQASIGKYLFGMKVVDKEGKRIEFWRALARLISKGLSYMFLFIGFVMIAFSKNKQGLHDLIVGTYVVQR